MRRLLIDANHLTGRCWATLQDMTTRKGDHSGVLHGFFNGLGFVKSELRIDLPEMLICWDGGRSAFRKALYPGYKSGRHSEDPTPDEIHLRNQYMHQLKALHEGLHLLGIPQIRTHGVEADDLIGIFSRWYEERGNPVIVYSGDHDMHQLVSDSVSVYDPKKGIQKQADILAKWEVSDVRCIPWHKAITGDTTDAISGINGIGWARANIILRHLNLDNPFEFDLTKIPDKEVKWVRKFIEHEELIHRNLKLMKIPRTWEEVFEVGLYEQDHAINSIEQLLRKQERRLNEFREFLFSWELTEVASRVEHWL